MAGEGVGDFGNARLQVILGDNGCQSTQISHDPRRKVAAHAQPPETPPSQARPLTSVNAAENLATPSGAVEAAAAQPQNRPSAPNQYPHQR